MKVPVETTNAQTGVLMPAEKPHHAAYSEPAITSGQIAYAVPARAAATRGVSREKRLAAIIASFHPLDDAAWADLVNSVVQAQ